MYYFKSHKSEPRGAWNSHYRRNESDYKKPGARQPARAPGLINFSYTYVVDLYVATCLYPHK